MVCHRFESIGKEIMTVPLYVVVVREFVIGNDRQILRLHEFIVFAGVGVIEAVQLRVIHQL